MPASLSRVARSPLAAALALLFITTATFFPVLGAHFVSWDDSINIFHNPHYEEATGPVLSAANLAFFWTHPYNHTYRPIVHMVWAGLCALSQANRPLWIPGSGPTWFDARWFHAANLLLHLANVLLVWVLARRWVRSSWSAAAGALVFAVHPVQVESVGWVTGGNDLLCAFFALLCTLAFCRYAQSPEEGRPRRLAYAAACLCFALALLAKPAAVALPLVLALLAVWGLNRPWRSLVASLAPWLVAGACWAWVTADVHPEAYAGAMPPLWERPLAAGDALAFYLAKLVAPWHLGIDYGRTPAWLEHQPWLWCAWLVPASLFALVWVGRRHSHWPLLALATAVAWLVPVIGFKPFHFQLVYSTVADRYLYFALVGPALALAVGFERLEQHWKVACLAPLLAWTSLSYAQAGTWHDNFSLFEQAARVNPRSWMAQANLGAAYDEEGETNNAAVHFSAALDLNPSLWQMHVKLARYAAAAHDEALARRHWQQVLRLDPGNVEATGALAGEDQQRPAL